MDNQLEYNFAMLDRNILIVIMSILRRRFAPYQIEQDLVESVQLGKTFDIESGPSFLKGRVKCVV